MQHKIKFIISKERKVLALDSLPFILTKKMIMLLRFLLEAV